MRKIITSLSCHISRVFILSVIFMIIVSSLLTTTAFGAPSILNTVHSPRIMTSVTTQVEVQVFRDKGLTKLIKTLPPETTVTIEPFIHCLDNKLITQFMDANTPEEAVTCVSFDGLNKGYVLTEELFAEPPPPPPPPDRGEEVVEYATQFLGVPYVWGGTSPKGFDCSGLIQYCYSKCLNISLPRTTYEQRHSGYRVSLQNAKPGDIVLMYGYEHVGLVAANNGDGTITYIHAPHSGDVVKRSVTGSCEEIRRIVD